MAPTEIATIAEKESGAAFEAWMSQKVGRNRLVGFRGVIIKFPGVTGLELRVVMTWVQGHEF